MRNSDRRYVVAAAFAGVLVGACVGFAMRSCMGGGEVTAVIETLDLAADELHDRNVELRECRLALEDTKLARDLKRGEKKRSDSGWNRTSLPPERIDELLADVVPPSPGTIELPLQELPDPDGAEWGSEPPKRVEANDGLKSYLADPARDGEVRPGPTRD